MLPKSAAVTRVLAHSPRSTAPDDRLHPLRRCARYIFLISRFVQRARHALSTRIIVFLRFRDLYRASDRDREAARAPWLPFCANSGQVLPYPPIYPRKNQGMFERRSDDHSETFNLKGAVVGREQTRKKSITPLMLSGYLGRFSKLISGRSNGGIPEGKAPISYLPTFLAFLLSITRPRFHVDSSMRLLISIRRWQSKYRV